jgi:arylsulfatase
MAGPTHPAILGRHARRSLLVRVGWADIPRGILAGNGANMGHTDRKDVVVAAYASEDLAKQDFETVLKLAGRQAIDIEGVVLVQKGLGGELSVTETGDHMGRKGLKKGGGVGLVIGLFAPPLLAATAVGAAAGALMGTFTKHRLESGIAETMDSALPPGGGGVIAVYDPAIGDMVDRALANAVTKSVAQIDGTSADELKAGIAEAEAGMVS